MTQPIEPLSTAERSRRKRERRGSEGLAAGGGLIGLSLRSVSRPVAYASGGALLILLTLLLPLWFRRRA